jgi:uncharacterized membrane protein YoaK (UPF0700 family)
MPTGDSNEDQRKLSLRTAALLAAAGGCLDSFTYIGHGHVFANAMTGNVVLLAIEVASGDWQKSWRHLPPIVTFLIGIVCVRILGFTRFGASLPLKAIAVLVIEMVSFFALSWLPADSDNFAMVIGVCFAASLQTATFRQVNNAAYNSTFTTGNLRTFGESFVDWVSRVNRPSSGQQAIDFAAVCVAFFAGALVGGISTPKIHNRTLLIVVGVLLAALIQFTARWRPRQEGSRKCPPAA